MMRKDSGPEQNQVGHLPKEESGSSYQLVYETIQGEDIEVQVKQTGPSIYTIDTPWYRASVRTYDLLDTIVHFCQALFGKGKLTVVLL